MIQIPPIVFRTHAKRVPMPPPGPPVGPPVLVGAVYDVGASVTLTFDRSIDAAAMDAASVVVNDGETMNFVYRGTGVDVVDATTVRVGLAGEIDGAEPGTWVTVAADNGIVAVDGGVAWAGCDAVALPFG